MSNVKFPRMSERISVVESIETLPARAEYEGKMKIYHPFAGTLSKKKKSITRLNGRNSMEGGGGLLLLISGRRDYYD